MRNWARGLLGRGAGGPSEEAWPPRPAARVGGGVPPRRTGFAEAGTRFDDVAPAGSAGMDDLDARLPPPGVEAVPVAGLRARHAPNRRLGREDTAGGGMVEGPDGVMRPHYWGHRERLRQRFREGGQEAMPEYELLELLLFNAIPRIDVKPLAKRLLATFGDLNGVVAASERRLLQVEGATERVHLQLKVAEAFAHRMARARVLDRCMISSWEDLLSYCKTVMAHRETEQVRVLYLDRKNVLIADEAQGEGTVDHVPVYPREIVRRALELNASAVILVHNHPSGDPNPSDEDVAMTARIEEACRAVGIAVHDHLVIGKDRDASLRAMGLM
jgi:DNA repair protein RadC